MKSILGNTRKPDITFYDNGRIDISSRVSKSLGLKQGDVIDVMDCGLEYYLYVKLHGPTVGKHEAQCYPTKRGGHHFRAYSFRLCQEMIKASGASLHKIQLCAGESCAVNDIGDVVPIIYKHILNKNDTGY